MAAVLLEGCRTDRIALRYVTIFQLACVAALIWSIFSTVVSPATLSALHCANCLQYRPAYYGSVGGGLSMTLNALETAHALRRDGREKTIWIECILIGSDVCLTSANTLCVFECQIWNVNVNQFHQSQPGTLMAWDVLFLFFFFRCLFGAPAIV